MCCDVKFEWDICYVVYYVFLMFRVIFVLFFDVGFDDVWFVKEGLGIVFFDLDFVMGVLGKDGEGGDVEVEFICFCEFF